MDKVLDGIKPVNAQTPIQPSAGRPASAPSSAQAPVSAPVYQPTAGVVDPNNLSTLEVPVQHQPVPQQYVQPVPVPAPTPAPVPQPSIAQPAPVPAATDPAPQVEHTFFDSDWKFEAEVGDTVLDRRLGKLFEDNGIRGEEVVRAVYNNELTDKDIHVLQSAMGADFDFMMELVNTVIDQGVNAEAAKVMEVVGGKGAWDVLSKWAAAQDIDAVTRKQLNDELAAGGMRAQNAARLLKQDFDKYATAQEKQAMGNFVNGNAQPQPAAAAPIAAPAHVNPATALLSGDTAVPAAAAGQFEPIKNARELAEISRKAMEAGTYDEDALAYRLKKSIDAGVYKRTAVPTPPPANLMQLRRSTAMY